MECKKMPPQIRFTSQEHISVGLQGFCQFQNHCCSLRSSNISSSRGRV